MINELVSYFNPDGTPTVEGMKFFKALDTRLDAVEAQMAAIAAVTEPTGGVMVDSEARTAIDDIIAAAG